MRGVWLLPAAAVAARLNLKLLTPAATQPPATDAGRGRVWLAASTHPGEDEIALAAHAALAARWPDARLILAPDWEPIVWTEADRRKGQAWGLKTIESFHTHGTPPVAVGGH